MNTLVNIGSIRWWLRLVCPGHIDVRHDEFDPDDTATPAPLPKPPPKPKRPHPGDL